MKYFTGPGNKLQEVGHKKLQEEIQKFQDFLHSYLHYNAIEDMNITFKGKFMEGVRATVTMEVDEDLRKNIQKRKK